MKLSKKLEAEVLEVYEAYWNGLFNADMETYTATLDKDFKLIGTTEAEIFFKRIEAVRFLEATAEQVAGNIELRNRIIKVEPVDTLMLITEQSDAYAKIDDVWTFYGKTRTSSLLMKKDTGWKFIQMHISFPDNRTEEGETIALEQIKAETLQLRDAVKRRTIELENKTRDLEIEASLERVRAVALGMKKPTDLPGICEVLFVELTTLGFAEIRNAMINIHDDDKGTFINYDYSDEIGQSINHLRYDIHPVIEKQIRQIRSAGDAFSETYFKGKDLEDWKVFRKNIGEKDDPRIEKTKALYYYFYSIGTGSIGISTFNSIAEEKLNVLKRFRNVFDFAYRRYMDVAQAEAQAKEAQIELALERVRARAMAMQNSDELIYVADVMREQMGILGQQALDTCAVHLYPNDSTSFDSWYAFRLESTGKIVSGKTSFPKDGCELIREMIDGYNSKLGDYILEAKGAKLKEWMEVLANAAPELTNNIGEIPETGYYHLSDFSGGSLVMASFQPPSAESIVLQKRCANTFDLAYRRYLDLKKAEAQSKEAQIELALERVRARTMAMQHSGELMDAANLLFQQVQSLEIPIWSCGYNIWEKGEQFCTGWMSTNGVIQPSFRIPLTESYTFIHMNESRMKGESFYVEEMSGEALPEHYRYMFSLPDFKAIADEQLKDGFALPTFQINHVFNFRHGNLIFLSGEPIPEAWDIFKRFTAVFEQTYSRFLDLQKAEAQAREAQIETALERVRSRTMGMQKSEELPEAANLLFQQMQALGMPAWSAGYCIWDEDKQGITLWMSSEGVMQPSFHAPLTEDPSFINFLEAYKKGETFFVNEIGGEALIEHYQYMRTLPVVGEILDSIINEGHSLPGSQIFHCAYFSQGFLLFITYEPVPEAHDIFKRFGKVFDQTYTRFLDLQQAEAQGREAQIELALERIRARSMSMQESANIHDVINVVTEQIQILEIHFDTANFITNHTDKGGDMWISTPGVPVPPKIFVPYADIKGFNQLINAKKQSNDFFSYTLSFEEKNEFFKHLFENTIAKVTPEGRKQYVYNTKGLAASVIFLNNVYFTLANYQSIPYTEQENAIIKRIGNVFEQSYTRFLDLQQAEAQARESQIQLALERVRARTMAMQKSEELKQVAALLFKQVSDLGINIWTTGFKVWSDDNNFCTDYVTNPQGGFMEPYIIDSSQYLAFVNVSDAKKRGDDFFMRFEEGEQLEETYKQLSKCGETQFKAILDSGFQFPSKQYEHHVFGSKSSLLFITYEPVPEAHDIFKRFGKVFEQTYTRFLDLQKAEAQAREAQIEAALEKVRSRSLAMHTASELGEVVTVIVEKLRDLGVVLDANGVILCTYFQHSKDVMHWIVSPDYSMAGSYLLPYFDHPIFNDAWQSRESGDEYFSKSFSVEEKNSFFEYAFEHSDYKYFPEDFKQWVFQNDKHVLSFAWQKNSAILIPSHTGVLPTEIDKAILIRFAKVFEQSYVRFLDLQKSEEQARESQIQLALERVRARTMAMQKSDELPETSYLLFQQVKELGLTAVQNSIGIVNEEAGFVELSTTVQGHHLPHTLNVPIDDPYVMAKAVVAWKAKRKSLKLEFEGQELKNYNEHRSSLKRK